MQARTVRLLLLLERKCVACLAQGLNHALAVAPDLLLPGLFVIHIHLLSTAVQSIVLLVPLEVFLRHARLLSLAGGLEEEQHDKLSAAPSAGRSRGVVSHLEVREAHLEVREAHGPQVTR